MKKLLVLTTVFALSMQAFAIKIVPHRPIPHRPISRWQPPVVHHRPIHPPIVPCQTWGRGGRNFWPSFGAGIVAGAVLTSIATPMQSTTVALPPPPVVIANPIWVPPVYETRPVRDAFGNIIRYEQILIRAGYWR